MQRLCLTLSLVLGLASPYAHAQIDPFDTAAALADLIRRSMALELLDRDPFLTPQSSSPKRFPERVCGAGEISQGLNENICQPVSFTECGNGCVRFTIDPAVFPKVANRIKADLAEPCKTIDKVPVPAGYRDSHPLYFFQSRNRSKFSLGCVTTPIIVESVTYTKSTLEIRYKS